MRAHILLLLVSFVVFGSFGVSNSSGNGLRSNFYKSTCRDAEKIVRDITYNRTKSNPALGAKLLRLHYHDCFVRGCDASVLLDSVGTNQSEKEARPNLSLSGFDVIDDIKNELEKKCPNIVSCADIVALAARDSVSFQFNKSMWDVFTGRKDGNVSRVSEVNGNLPSPFANFTTLLQLFAIKGLNVKDLVALSGAHTIGVAHCGAFSRRLFNFTGNGDADPSLDATYANSLRSLCPNPPDANTTVEMDPQSSLSFDSHYFTILNQNKGLFQSDAALLTDQGSAKITKQFQKNNTFFAEFAVSMKNMGAVGVLTGNAGEIRRNCRAINTRN